MKHLLIFYWLTFPNDEKKDVLISYSFVPYYPECKTMVYGNCLQQNNHHFKIHINDNDKFYLFMTPVHLISGLVFHTNRLTFRLLMLPSNCLKVVMERGSHSLLIAKACFESSSELVLQMTRTA